jgi:N-acetylmuramoyl-L-alanine amidase
MIRLFILCAVLWAGSFAFAAAQPVQTPARVDAASSGLKQDWLGRTTLRLELSRGVPFRVFVLENPARLVLDFRDLSWEGVSPNDIMGDTTGISAVRFGPFQRGWSRLVADMTRPMLPDEIEMAVDAQSGRAILSLDLVQATDDAFTAASGAPDDALWPAPVAEKQPPPVDDDRFAVVIDPGHGGIDPGAEREGLSEKVLMLDVALALRDILQAVEGVDVVLTRESDVFVSLQSRVALAHQVGGDLFVSLHADALSQGGARGATIYTLSEEASDTASAHLAARHNRADIIAGADLSGSDDEVTRVLLDLARQETEPRSRSLAKAFADSMDAAGGPMNSRTLRQAGFSVLKSADIPSVLIEIGFLSSKRDLENLRDPVWRRKMTEAMARGILNWRDYDLAQRALMRH